MLLDAVQLRIALAQAGYRDRFGRPAAEVTARCAERGIAMVASARCGAARWSSAHPAAVRCERQEGQRYWHHQPP